MNRRSRLEVAVQKTLRRPGLPRAAEVREWVRAAAADAAGEVTVRIVGDDESAALNARYRGRQGATNVLAFPAAEDARPAGGLRPEGEAAPSESGAPEADGPPPLGFGLPPLGDELPPLGDIVVCAPVVMREAAEQGKTPEAHWAHIVIHGTLHLVGYDHLQDADARVMEERERTLLAGFGFPDPYSLERQ